MSEAIVYLNGAFVPESEAKVSVFDRCFLYGDGIFEGIAVWDRAPFRLKPHLDRLARGLRYMLIDEPYDHAGWRQIIVDLIEKNALQDGYLRLQVSRGEGMSSIKWEKRLLRKPEPNVTIIPIAGFATYYGGLFGRTDEEGMRAITVPRPRIASHAVPTGMKHCNYLGSVLGAIDVTGRGADIGISVDAEGFVAEGIAYNIFAVVEGRLMTPPTTRDILPGITRATILELARANGIVVEERDFDTYALASADEAFISSTLELAVPVTELDGRRIGSGKPGVVTRRVSGLLKDAMAREAALFHGESKSQPAGISAR
jgi:branched-chain amino acid aminotransferase